MGDVPARSDNRSNYRQWRLTVTEETGRRLTVRLQVKRLEDGWQDGTTVLHDHLVGTAPFDGAHSMFRFLREYFARLAG